MKSSKKIFTFIITAVWSYNIYAQCCGGGSGSPIGGGASQGVLQDYQVEINNSLQYINTNKFLTGSTPDTSFLDNFNSKYLYTRLAYGVSKNFTMSIESGYFIKKTQVGLNKSDTITSSGIGDLILFPRYDIINHTKNGKQTEFTVGLGIKIPLGKYNDSLGMIEPFSGETFYVPKPMVVQPSSGAHDIIFYTFLFRSYPVRSFRIFANALYIKKGWNPVGEKIGDYATVGIFAGKTFFQKLGVTLQIKGEWVDKMKLNNDILLYAYPSYDPEATGSRKIFVVPQLSYSFKEKITFYALSEFPVYQNVIKTQIASQYQATLGISYRFFAKQKISIEQNKQAEPVIE